MNATNRYLNRLIHLKGFRSDYQLSKYLGVSTASVSIWRSGSSQLGDDMAFRVARELDLDPIEILSAIGAERAKDQATQETWRSIFRKVTQNAQAIALSGAAIFAIGGIHDGAIGSHAEAENQAFLAPPALPDAFSGLNIMLSREAPIAMHGPLSMPRPSDVLSVAVILLTVAALSIFRPRSRRRPE